MSAEAKAGTATDQLADENALLRASLAEMRARLAELEEAADRDPLTGLPNRDQFLRELERAVSQTNRHGTPAAVLAIGLSGLAEINARHGRLAGDAALIHLAKLLKQLIRGSDFAARTGGDRFGLILGHLDAHSAIDTSERIERCISAQPLDLGSAAVGLWASIGVATILQGDSVEDVLARSDASLERARLF